MLTHFPHPLSIYNSKDSFHMDLFSELHSLLQKWKSICTIWEYRLLVNYVDIMKKNINEYSMSDYWYDRFKKKLGILNLEKVYSIMMENKDRSFSESYLMNLLLIQQKELLLEYISILYGKSSPIHRLWVDHYLEWFSEWKQLSNPHPTYAQFVYDKLPESKSNDYLSFLNEMFIPLPLPTISFFYFVLILSTSIIITCLFLFILYMFLKHKKE